MPSNVSSVPTVTDQVPMVKVSKNCCKSFHVNLMEMNKEYVHMPRDENDFLKTALTFKFTRVDKI